MTIQRLLLPENIITIVMAMLCVLFFIEPSLASDPWATAEEVTKTAKDNIRKIVLVLAVIGFFVLAVMAFFGKFKIVWFISLIGGLLLVLLSTQLVDWISGYSS